MNSKICCIFNVAPHYNAPIYNLMDKELNCDFYLGDRVPYQIELMKYDSLKGYKKILKNKKIFGNFYWQKGAVSTVFKGYEHCILTGEPYCISTWLVLLTNRLTCRKTYLWTHGWYGNETGLKKIVKKVFFKLSDKVLLYGDYAKSLMIKEGFDPLKLITIYNSLDYDKQFSIRQNLTLTQIYKEHFGNSYPVLLYVGRIQSRKKIELLIESLNELRKRKSTCNLILIGKHTEETNIHELISNYELSKYVWHFGPSFDENILGELIFNADVCVVPGDIGLTAMHSLVYGTPVITHNNFPSHGPEFEAIKSGLNGDFFVEDSVPDLCDTIQKWINLADKKRDSVRQECYNEIKEKYNPEKQIEILKTLFNI